MGFIAWLKKAFRPIIKALWGMLKEIFSGGTEILLAQIRELAIEAVLMVAADHTVVTDEDKRKKAFEILKEKALKRGLTVKTSLCNLALELAVAYLKQAGRLS